MTKRKRLQSSSQMWCHVCKIWIADNRAQRDQHEMGTKHKAAYAKLIKAIARKNELARTSEPEPPRPILTPHLAERKQSAAEQLLESAVSGYSQVHNMTHHASSVAEQPVGKTSQVTLLPEERERMRNLSDSNDLDENGFPLPANVVMGPWTSVKDTTDSEHDNNLNTKEGTAEKIEATAGLEGKPATSTIFKTRKSGATKRRRRAHD